MVKVVRQKGQTRRRLCFVGLLIILSAAAGWTLHRFSLSLQDIGRIIQLAAGKISEPAGQVRAEQQKLRGTIYDRNFNELSVSYQLYSLYVHAAELTDRKNTAQALAPILGMDKERLADQLKSSERVIDLAVDLDAGQVADVLALGIKGIVCKPVEERYYPAHTMAAHLLGFTGKGTGLSGVEAIYDPVLQPGEFGAADIPEIDLANADKLGLLSDDIILTIDLDLQKEVEQQLAAYRRSKGAARGSALVLDPGSGRVLAMVSQPGFDPNYFWQADSERLKNHVFAQEFDPALVRPLLVTAAAIDESGLEGNLLPATVRAPDYGLTKTKIAGYLEKFAFQRPVDDPLAVAEKKSARGSGEERDAELLSPAQLAVGCASLLNGGNRMMPYFFHSLYDQKSGVTIPRDGDLILRERVVPPAAGIHLRRELLLNSTYSSNQGFVFVRSNSAVSANKGFSEYRVQEVLVAAVPRKVPKVMLVMAVDYGTLYPLMGDLTKKKKKNRELAAVGTRLLPVLERYGSNEGLGEHPAAKAEENYRRFLISRHLDLPVEKKEYGPVEHQMPQLTGLSLRKGLQQISPYGLEVSVTGTGVIVSQYPAPGEPLRQSGVCRLTLESEI